MNSGLFITPSSSIVIYTFAKQSLTVKRFNFWSLPGWRFCALRDAIMGLRSKKKKKNLYPSMTSHSFFLHKWIWNIFFLQYVNIHIHSIFKVTWHPVWASLIILLDNCFSCCSESTIFLPSLKFNLLIFNQICSKSPSRDFIMDGNSVSW
jgi:hypothetical protein